MQCNIFKVKYVTVKNCFIYLPDNWEKHSTTKDNVVKITHNDRELYFSWNSQAASQENHLRINATFARVLGIHENDEVITSFAACPRSVARIVVVPRSSQDLEIVELQSDKIQESLLDQINVVAVNQQIVIWISKCLSVILTVESIEPNYKYGKLEPFTEVEVSLPKPKKLEPKGEDLAKSGVWYGFKSLLPKMLSGNKPEKESEKHVETVENMLRKSSGINLPEIYRVLPLKSLDNVDSMSSRDSLLSQPYNIFVEQRFLPNKVKSELISTGFYCRVKRVEQNAQFINKVGTNTNFLTNESAETFNTAKEITARMFVVEQFLNMCSNNIGKEYFPDNSKHKSIYVSDNLRHNLKLKVGAKVLVELMEYKEQTIHSIEIFPQNNSTTLKNILTYFEQHSKYNKLLINSLSNLNLSNEISCFVKILPPETSYASVDFYDVKNLPINVRETLGNSQNEIKSLENSDKIISLETVSTRYLKPILSECQSVLKLSLQLDKTLDFGYDRENILLCGKVGGGKSTVCQILKETLRVSPNFVHFNEIDCKALKGKKVEILHKTFLPIILDCVYHQPSVLVIDDLESIAGRVSDEEENTPDSINTARIADMLLNMITEYQAVHYVAVVATCTSVGKISQKLAAPRGIHLFRTILTIPDLEKEDRVEILKLCLKSKLKISKDVDWNDYGNKTEGWVSQDLINFAKKAVFTAWKRHVKSGAKDSLTICENDLSLSLENSMPMSLQGVDLYSGPGHAWSDIGGLSEAKQSLIELLHWPLKYPELFKNAPIKHQGGVLLYGAPGTGKTMLAGAIARECGLSFISVKGPELLSKYIGASEEAVRNVFEKANSAKPCVLFFDEFDSLAPRRGHDSTGVTDRVVNQFLAQLDGVEGRQGVAVVAASSRPDLLDPALLRPGRLDKAILCPLPNETERKEILSALCRSQKIDSSLLDLKTVAKITDGFTGADLNAIISQGRLSALEESLANRKATGSDNYSDYSGLMIKTNGNTLTQKHLIDSLGSTRPSLTRGEQLKYDKIYAKFSGAEEFYDNLNMLNNSNYQRATLA